MSLQVNREPPTLCPHCGKLGILLRLVRVGASEPGVRGRWAAYWYCLTCAWAAPVKP